MDHLIDGLIYFLQAFVILSAISLIGAGVTWVWTKISK